MRNPLAGWLNRLRGQRAIPITNIDDYIQTINDYHLSTGLYGTGIQQTLGGGRATQQIGGDFAALAQQAYASNGIVFAVMLVRQLTFSSIRFRWQRLLDGAPSETFGTTDLGMLERPWPGGTTQDLLSRTIQDVDLAGNAYWTRDGAELVRLRPDWVEVILEKRMVPFTRLREDGTGVETLRGQLGWRKVGYLYTEGGPRSGEEPVPLLASEVAHYAPHPDPLAPFRGMSWLTPVVREIEADKAMTRHRIKFFDNGATPNMIIKHVAGADEKKVQRWMEQMREKNVGIENAYKDLHLYPGADATVVGRDFKQIDFKSVQGAGETRIAAAGGVPPVIVGLSEGLEAATYSNYGQARRRLADGTAHPLWQNASGSFEPLLTMPPGKNVRLWYDAQDVPFLREDEKDAAEIAEIKARTIQAYITAGYEPASVVRAVEANDLRLLVHTGLYSVQLQKPGSEAPLALPGPPADDDTQPPDEGDGNGNPNQ